MFLNRFFFILLLLFGELGIYFYKCNNSIFTFGLIGGRGYTRWVPGSRSDGSDDGNGHGVRDGSLDSRSNGTRDGGGHDVRDGSPGY